MLDYLIHCPPEVYSTTAIGLTVACLLILFLQRWFYRKGAETVSMALVALAGLNCIALVAIFLFHLCFWEGPTV